MPAATLPAANGWTRPSRSSLLLMLLLAGMVALGLWSAWPPAPRPVDAPQPLLQVYRGGVPQDLLLALPLRAGDEVRVVAEAPNDLFFAFFWVEPDGTVRELEPLARRQTGALQELAHPELRPMPLPPGAGTRLAVVVGASRQPPRLAEVADCLGKESWPRLPRSFLMQLSPRGAELIGPKGLKLPPAGEVKAMEDRLRAAAEALRSRFPFFLAVAAPCE